MEKKIGIKKGDVVELTKTIQYTKNAIVSKALIDKKAGTLTLFAFDKGQGLSEHTAPFDAIVQILDGEAEVEINKKKMVVVQGCCVIMPAGVPHALKAIRPFKMLLIMLRTK